MSGHDFEKSIPGGLEERIRTLQDQAMHQVAGELQAIRDTLRELGDAQEALSIDMAATEIRGDELQAGMLALQDSDSAAATAASAAPHYIVNQISGMVHVVFGDHMAGTALVAGCGWKAGRSRTPYELATVIGDSPSTPWCPKCFSSCGRGRPSGSKCTQ